MKRNPASLKGRQFDVVIIGGGAFGASAAREAALRNLSVALIEAHDFGSGTSANSFKFVHGGIRYLQHLDFRRLRASCHERSALLRIAPHLVKPMPVAMPTYGHGREGKAFLGTGFKLYDAITADRNRGIADRSRHIPPTGSMSRENVLARFPGVPADGLTGAAVFSDAQMFHPPRLVLAFVQSAVECGAEALNYAEAVELLRQGDDIRGVRVRDRLTGDAFELRGRVVLNAAAAWSEQILGGDGLTVPGAGVYSRDTCFLIDAAGDTDCALAVKGRSVDKGAVIARGARHLFVVPWRGRRLVGVWHGVYRKGPDSLDVSEEELSRFIDEYNASLPEMAIRREDIRLVNAGLVPFGDSDDKGEELNFGKRSHLVDSEEAHGLRGLVTLIGVRHTMARGDAARAMDIIERKLKRRAKAPDSAFEPLAGGDIDDVSNLEKRVAAALGGSDTRPLAAELTALYGTRAVALVENAAPGDNAPLGGAPVTRAQVAAAVNEEMAVTLSDLVFRRTPLCAAGHPGNAALDACSRTMAGLLGWSEERRRRELDAVLARFPGPASCGRISEKGSLPEDEAAAEDKACRVL